MIELQPFKREDIPRLLGWITSEADLVQWSGHSFSYPLTLQKLEEFFSTAAREPGKYHIFRVSGGQPTRILGHIELSLKDDAEGHGHISRVLVGERAEQGKGYGTRMVEEILRYGFQTLNLQLITLNVVIFNMAAIACYKKTGFRTVKTIDEACSIGDKKWSYYHMQITRDEWLRSR